MGSVPIQRLGRGMTPLKTSGSHCVRFDRRYITICLSCEEIYNEAAKVVVYVYMYTIVNVPLRVYYMNYCARGIVKRLIQQEVKLSAALACGNQRNYLHSIRVTGL